MSRRSADFHLAQAESVDFKERKLKCRSVIDFNKVYNLEYDKLVIGVGALPNTYKVPGVEDNALFLKEISDARKIRTKLIGNYELSLFPGLRADERSRLLHTVIVGGGPTGVEFGAELYDFLEQDVKRLYKQEEMPVKVTLIESQKILGAFDSKLQAFAEKKIRERENFELIQSSVTAVHSDSVYLADGRRIPCGLVVWSTGLAPRPFTASLKVKKTKEGQVLTDRWLRVLSDETGHSYALGDCADIREFPLPCTAQVAERKGRYLAKQFNLIQTSPDSHIPQFTFKSMGMMAYVGGNKGLSDLPGIKLSGFSSWFLWRSAYLTRLGSWRSRLQVPLDWLKTFIYGRDTSRF